MAKGSSQGKPKKFRPNFGRTPPPVKAKNTAERARDARDARARQVCCHSVLGALPSIVLLAIHGFVWMKMQDGLLKLGILLNTAFFFSVFLVARFGAAPFRRCQQRCAKRKREAERKAVHEETANVKRLEREAASKVEKEKRDAAKKKRAAAALAKAQVSERKRKKQCIDGAVAAARTSEKAAAAFATAARKSVSTARSKMRKMAKKRLAAAGAACTVARAASGHAIAAREAARQFALDAVEAKEMFEIEGNEKALAAVARYKATVNAMKCVFAARDSAKIAERAVSTAVRVRKEHRAQQLAVGEHIADVAIKACVAAYEGAAFANQATIKANEVIDANTMKGSDMLAALTGGDGRSWAADDDDDDDEYSENMMLLMGESEEEPTAETTAQTLETTIATLRSEGGLAARGHPSSHHASPTTLGGGSDESESGSEGGAASGPIGLSNATGQNNCFLNVVVQALFHLSTFRRPFMLMRGRVVAPSAAAESAAAEESSSSLNIWAKRREERVQPPQALFDALQQTMLQLSDSHASLVAQSASGDEMRAVLARAFSEFRLGEMSDAAEAHTRVLETLQTVFSMDSIEDDGGSAGSGDLIDACFGMNLRATWICSCGHAQNPELSMPLLVEHIYVHALVRANNKTQKGFRYFDALCRETNAETLPKCDKCYLPVPQCRSLTPRTPGSDDALPSVITLGLVWMTANPGSAGIAELLDCIDPFIYPHRLFDSSGVVPEPTPPRVAQLRGMICYYGRHYVACFYSEEQRQWLSFDDIRVHSVGAEWSDAVAHCSKSRYQPLLLFYQTLDSAIPMPRGRGRSDDAALGTKSKKKKKKKKKTTPTQTPKQSRGSRGLRRSPRGRGSGGGTPVSSSSPTPSRSGRKQRRGNSGSRASGARR